MASTQEVVSFDQIIEKDRARRKNEALANEIFGRGRKRTDTTAPVRKAGHGPSLASRIGIVKASKRSTSNTPKQKGNVDGLWSHDLHPISNPAKAPRVTRTAKENPVVRAAKNELLYEAATNKVSQTEVAAELNIRGIAGPYTVIGSNFAPGTTAADIESAMLPVGGEMQSCRILTASPTVMAEMVFADKDKAEVVIETFNNKKADGRILHVYMRRGPPQAPAAAAGSFINKTVVEPRVPATVLTQNGPPSSYDSQRERSDRNRRRAEPELQDGSYGFEAQADTMDVDMEAPAPLGAEQPSSRRPDYQNGRRDDRHGDRGDERRPDLRYDNQGYGRGSYDRRERNGGGPRVRDQRRLYSDDIYRPPRGQGYR